MSGVARRLSWTRTSSVHTICRRAKVFGKRIERDGGFRRINSTPTNFLDFYLSPHGTTSKEGTSTKQPTPTRHTRRQDPIRNLADRRPAILPLRAWAATESQLVRNARGQLGSPEGEPARNERRRKTRASAQKR